jgi:hypothetical protein
VSVINLSEQDFSLCVDYDLPQQDPYTTGNFNKLLVSALLISLLLHFLLFLLKPLWYSPKAQTSQSIVISLHNIKKPEALTKELKTTTSHIDRPAEELVEIKPQVNTDVNIISSQPIADSTVSKRLELLSTEDYTDLAQNKSKINKTDSLAFNPHLKKQLQKTRQVNNERGKKSIGWQDAGGNLYYKAGGQCFMSPPQNMTSSMREGKNWYMVSCGGKSESENMMDNVNQEMKARFEQ